MHLEDIRKEIDQVDRELIHLLEKRMDLVKHVIAYKKENQLPILDSQREQAVLDKVSLLVSNPAYQSAVVDTFSDIMKNSRHYQHQQLSQKE